MKKWYVKEGRIIGYSGRDLVVTMPDAINGNVILEIDRMAFSPYKPNLSDGTVEARDSIQAVVLPKGLKRIGDDAFHGCKSLQEIELPDGLESIGESAFYGCESLKRIVIPKTVREIGKGAFSYCINLEEVVLPAGMITTPKSGFSYCENLSSIVFPASMETISSFSFKDCIRLSEIVFPEKLKKIELSAFENCVRVQKVVFTGETKTIDTHVFMNCQGLKHLIFSKKIRSIGSEAFRGCVSLESVFFPEGLHDIQNDAFYECSALASVDIPKTLSSIDTNVFRGCKGLKELIIRGEYTKIRESHSKYWRSRTMLDSLSEDIHDPQSAWINTSPNYKFKDSVQLTIICPADSLAENFAKDNQIPCRLLDDSKREKESVGEENDPEAIDTCSEDNGDAESMPEEDYLFEQLNAEDPCCLKIETRNRIRLPVKTSSGEIVDISGYYEYCELNNDTDCGDKRFYYIHMPDNSIVSIGEGAAQYSSWDEFLINNPRTVIDQEKAADAIKKKYHCNAQGKIVKDVRGNYLDEYGTAYNCTGYYRVSKHNYQNVKDLFEWYYCGAKYVFALYSNGSINLINVMGAVDFFKNIEQNAKYFNELENISKVVSKDASSFAFLHFNGEVSFMDHTPEKLYKLAGWEDIVDITFCSGTLVGLTKQGRMLFHPKTIQVYEWETFDYIVKRKNSRGRFDRASLNAADFRNYPLVYHKGKTIYGFKRDGSMLEYNLSRSGQYYRYPITLKRVIFSSSHGMYFVSEDGRSYQRKWDSEVEELKGVYDLQTIVRGGYCTERGEYFDKWTINRPEQEIAPTRTGIRTIHECEEYYAFLYENGDLEVFPEDPVRYHPSVIQSIKKACFTDTHIVFLHEDGKVGYVGQSTGRSCTGLNKISDALDISAALYETVVTLKNGERVRFPKQSKRKQ